MEVKQIYQIMNDVTKEITGKEDLLQEDLSNIVTVGTEIFNASSVDNYVRTLVDKVGKVIFVARPYSGKAPTVLMDAWDYGSVVQKISADLPQAVENKSWELEDGTDYSPNVFYKPSVSNKFFNNKSTFEVDMSFTELQVKESFRTATEINSFISMLYNAVDTAFTVRVDGLIMRTINSMIAETLHANAGKTSINLLTAYNTDTGESLKASNALRDKEFMRFATMQIALYRDRIGRISSLFNIGGKDKFTSDADLRTVMLADFKESAEVYLQSDTYHDEFLYLPNADIIPYWQGSGKDYAFNSVSAINCTTASDNSAITAQGIVCVMFDRDALGVTNYERRVTTNYNPKAEFYSNFYKMDCGAFNDLNENCIVFYVADNDVATVSTKSNKK